MKFNTGIEADKEGIRLGHFYGAHLRTELDAQAAGWTPYEIQSENYLTHAQNSQIKTIYLVSGNEEDAIRFRESAMEMGMQVATRDELLSEEGYEMDMQEMEVLSWDQKECVDYEVLLRARAMGGSHESTFAWNVALRRHVVDGQGVWVPVVDLGVERRDVEDEGEGGEVNEDDQSPNEEGNAEGEEDTPNEATSNTLQNSFQDSLSTIYGPGDEGMSIKVGMWP
ncbi:hypothetical protein M7I_1127 [Glarea lozoyensis 74030]|nr:hypothetical protein M7I_1127 [Glarea lozoyensis 74030]